MTRASLDDIACDFQTDKSTRSRLVSTGDKYDSRPSQGHGYTIYYEHYLSKLRDQPIRLLEIGVLDGKSLATWAEYFPHASLYGLDIDPDCKRFANERTQILTGSQSDQDFLAEICRQVPEGFDIIIDDGSHYVKHVIASFAGLFGSLKPGGLYIIEDLHIANWRDWGRVALNKGMDLEQDSQGNDPAEMVRFLTGVRERADVAELIVHLKKICFIRKLGPGAEKRAEWDRGDRLDELFPAPPPTPSLLRRVLRRVARAV